MQKVCCLGYRALSGLDVHLFQDWNLDLLGETQDCALDVPRVKPGLFVLLELRRGLKVGIGNDHWSEFQVALVEQTVKGQKVEDVVTESTNTALLDGDEDAVVVCELPDQVNVQRFHVPGVGDGDAQVGVFVLDLLGGDQCLVEAGSDRENGDAVLALLAPRAGMLVDLTTSSANDASLTDGNDFA